MDEQKRMEIDQEIRKELTKLAVDSIYYVAQSGGVYHRFLMERFELTEHQAWKVLWATQQDLIARIKKAGG